MKPLKPSHREHKRYLLVSGKDASKENIEDAILKYVGILGYSKASPMIIKNIGAKIVISINRQELNNVRAALLVSGKQMRIEKVSGTIGKL